VLVALREALPRRAATHHIGLSAQFQFASLSLGGEQVECIGAAVVQAVGSAALSVQLSVIDSRMYLVSRLFESKRGAACTAAQIDHAHVYQWWRQTW
jgi:uncharacterized protein (UPF0218 family)